jgi:CspA family cold shock protein
MSELHRGVVKWFNDAKGFGFIEHESGKDVFVHYSVIDSEGFRTLKDGETVEYELRVGDKGMNASRVVRTSQPKGATNDGTAETAGIAAEIERSAAIAASDAPIGAPIAAEGERAGTEY